jgi:hypothetical protein
LRPQKFIELAFLTEHAIFCSRVSLTFPQRGAPWRRSAQYPVTSLNA